MTTYPALPKLAAEVSRADSESIELTLLGNEYRIEHPEQEELFRLLVELDGQQSVEALVERVGLSHEEVDQALTLLDAGGFLDDEAAPAARRSIDVMFDLEDRLNTLFAECVEQGRFWTAIIADPSAVSENVFYGMAIENWHFLYRENLFDSALLTFPGNREIRAHLNEFYIEEHRHDDIVLGAFAALGLTPTDMRSARPLPSTTALVNALAWWARVDPIFFMATVGVLEGGLVTAGDTDSFIEACELRGLPAGFIAPLKAHARINSGHDHGHVSRELLAGLGAINAETERRMLGQAQLFMELYANFYNGILDYYSDPSAPLLRTLPSARPHTLTESVR